MPCSGLQRALENYVLYMKHCVSRYKVTQKIVNEMRQIRKKTGLSYRKIAKRFKVSPHTAYYWIDGKYRKKKQLINSHRRWDKKDRRVSRTPRAVAKRRVLWKKLPRTYLEHELITAKNEHRCKRYSIQGIPISEVEKYLKQFKTGGQKVI